MELEETNKKVREVLRTNGIIPNNFNLEARMLGPVVDKTIEITARLVISEIFSDISHNLRQRERHALKSIYEIIEEVKAKWMVNQ